MSLVALAKRYWIIAFALSLMCILLLGISESLKMLAKRREDYFGSIQIVLVSYAEDASKDRARKYSTFNEISMDYAGFDEREWNDRIYGWYPHAPKIIYHNGVVVESKDYPVSLFASDYLEISGPRYVVRWVKSGRIVSEGIPPR